MFEHEFVPHQTARERTRAIVYRALLDADAVAIWKVPTGMTSHVHEFDAREGGSFRISLTYDAATETGKTTAHTDTYQGRWRLSVYGKKQRSARNNSADEIEDDRQIIVGDQNPDVDTSRGGQ